MDARPVQRLGGQLWRDILVEEGDGIVVPVLHPLVISRVGPQPERAHEFARSLALAHLDAYLREDAQALAFLRDGAIQALRARGVDTRQLPAAN